jgi:hypothetical protein
MNSRLKLQYGYLLNRVSIGFLISVLIIDSIGILYASGCFEPAGEVDIDRIGHMAAYLEEALSITKFLMVTTAIFLGIQGYHSPFNRYHIFFLQGGFGKRKLALTKITAIALLETVLYLHAVLMIHLVGWYLTPFFRFDLRTLVIMAFILAQIILFGLMEALVMQLCDSIFSGFIPLFYFWIMEANADYESVRSAGWLRLMHYLIPNPILTENGFILYYDGFHYLIILILIIVCNVLVFISKDLK